jgi:hypothetical protein
VPEHPTPDYLALLRTLLEHGVDFIVVGGVAAVLHGAPIATFDLDVVHSRTAANVARVLRALDTLDACYRTIPGKRLRPDASHLSSPGHQLLMTRFGPLDLLGALTGGRGYEQLLPDAIEIAVGPDASVWTLSLPTLIEVKEQTAGEKDKAALPILRRTLSEQTSARTTEDRTPDDIQEG